MSFAIHNLTDWLHPTSLTLVSPSMETFATQFNRWYVSPKMFEMFERLRPAGEPRRWSSMHGITLTVDGYMPDNLIACIDRAGNLLVIRVGSTSPAAAADPPGPRSAP